VVVGYVDDTPFVRLDSDAAGAVGGAGGAGALGPGDAKRQGRAQLSRRNLWIAGGYYVRARRPSGAGSGPRHDPHPRRRASVAPSVGVRASHRGCGAHPARTLEEPAGTFKRFYFVWT